jgi:hypothetical protein
MLVKGDSVNSDPVNSDSVFIPALVIFNPQFQRLHYDLIYYIFFVADDCLVTYILREIFFLKWTIVLLHIFIELFTKIYKIIYTLHKIIYIIFVAAHAI